MKNIRSYDWLAFTIVLAMFVCSSFNIDGKDGASMTESLGEHKQQDTLVLAPVIEPTFVNKYHRLGKRNIEAFVQDWKEWSLELRTYSTDSTVNQAISRIMYEFSDENPPENSIFYSFPCCIEIRKYYGCHPINDEKEDRMQLVERYAYIPSFDSEKVILYMTPEIEELLSRYLGGIRRIGQLLTSIKKGRVSYLSRLFYVHYGHWGGYWILYSMPRIYRLNMYDDGISAYLRTSWHTGETVFVPSDSAKEVVHDSFWIE